MATTAPADVTAIEIAYPTTGEATLQLRLGPCRVRFTPGDGPAWVTGTYTDLSRTLPIDVRTAGGRSVIAQRFDPGLFETVELPQLDLVVARDRPFSLDLQLGATETVFDLGGLSLTALAVKGGAGRFDIDFTRPNPADLARIELAMGAGSLVLRHVANANFSELHLGGGVSACSLDFSGELRRDAHATIEAGLASVDVSFPGTAAARVTKKSLAASTRAIGPFTQKDGAYCTPAAIAGAHPSLDIDVSLALGSLGISAT